MLIRSRSARLPPVIESLKSSRRHGGIRSSPVYLNGPNSVPAWRLELGEPGTGLTSGIGVLNGMRAASRMFLVPRRPRPQGSVLSGQSSSLYFCRLRLMDQKERPDLFTIRTLSLGLHALANGNQVLLTHLKSVGTVTRFKLVRYYARCCSQS